MGQMEAFKGLKLIANDVHDAGQSIASANSWGSFFIAMAINDAGKNISGSIEEAGEAIQIGLGYVSNAILKGLSTISDEMLAKRLSNEYYLLLENLMKLKKEYPALKLSVDQDYIKNHAVYLDEKNIIVMALVFTRFPHAFERFVSEIDAGCPLNKWLFSVFERAHYIFKKNKYKPDIYEGFTIRDTLEMRIFDDVTDMDEEFIDDSYFYTSYPKYPAERVSYFEFDEEKYDAIINKLYEIYHTVENANSFYSISNGFNQLTSWIERSNTQYLIRYLKEVYTKAVFSLLND